MCVGAQPACAPSAQINVIADDTAAIVVAASSVHHRCTAVYSSLIVGAYAIRPYSSDGVVGIVAPRWGSGRIRRSAPTSLSASLLTLRHGGVHGRHAERPRR